MNWKLGLAIVVLLACIAGGAIFLKTRQPRPPVALTLSLSIQPAGESAFVLARAQSAKFKYLLGKTSGTKPSLAQKLSIKPLPEAGQVEATVGLSTKEEAARYLDHFLPALQGECGTRAQITLLRYSVQ